MTDPYQRRPEDEPQGPRAPQWPGQEPYRQQPYDQPYQPGPYGGAPYAGAGPYGSPQPGPYGGQQDVTQQFGGPYPAGTPDPTRQFGPYDTQQFGPYGVQPYQGSYGQPPGWGTGGGQLPPSPQPPRPSRKSMLPVVLIAVLAAVILAGSGVAAVILVNRNSDSTAAQTSSATTTTTTQQSTTTPPTTTAPTTAAEFQVGQCATLTPQPGDRATIRITDCGGEASDVLIAKVQGSRCDRPYISFDPGRGKVYCLAMDAQVGACYRLDNLIKRAACSGAEPRKVLQIFDGATDDKQCQRVRGSVVSFAYPEPPKTVCLGRVS